MTSFLSENGAKQYFCTEPWVGLFAIATNQDVTFCPCFLKMKIGNLRESSIHEIWNAEPLIELRRSFREGVLPEPCRGQLCPVATQSLPGSPTLIDGVNGEESTLDLSPAPLRVSGPASGFER